MDRITIIFDKDTVYDNLVIHFFGDGEEIDGGYALDIARRYDVRLDIIKEIIHERHKEPIPRTVYLRAYENDIPREATKSSKSWHEE